MDFTVSKTDLVRELSLSQGVVEKKTTIPILSNVLLEAEGDRLTLTATDLELGIRCGCQARVKASGSGTVPARRLLDYVRLLPEGDVHIKFTDTNWANITCGRSKTRIAGMSRESFPELPERPASLFQIPARILASMMAKTIFAISNEESRFSLNGALFLITSDKLSMVSTDSHRLPLVEYPAELPAVPSSFRALLPKKAMAELMKLVGDSSDDVTVLFAGDDNHLFFQLGDRLLISRKLTGNFPDFERVLPKDHSRTIIIPRDEFRSSLERVAQFADERLKSIRVRASSGELKLFSSISDTGESEEVLPVEYAGPTVEIGFNAGYLLDFLRAITEPEVGFYFRDSQSAGEFRPAGENLTYNYRYVVMPLRL